MTHPKSGTIPVAGGALAYDEAGEGRPIVLLHAAIADRRQWDREVRTLSERHRVVRYDIRGLGKSTPATAPYSDADDLAAVVEHLKLPRPVLVGSSNGGRIAIDYAVTHPGQAAALLLQAPGVSGFDTDMAPDGMADYQRDGERSKKIVDDWKAGRRKEALDGLQEYWCSAAEGPAKRAVRQMMEDNAEEIFGEKSGAFSQPPNPPSAGRLAELHLPTVVLLGDRDEPTVGHIGRYIARTVPGAKLVPVPGADHLINLSRPSAFDEALAGLLRT